jgi:hypothetical protein
VSRCIYRINYRLAHWKIRILQFRLKYISAAGNITFIAAFQRAVSISSSLYNWAQHKPPFTATLQDGSFVLTNQIDAPMRLPVEKFSQAATISSVNLKSCVEAALPANVSIHDLPVRLLTDDFSSIPLHLQPQNTSVLEPIISVCWKQLLAGPLFNGAGVIRAEVDRWLRQYDDCYPSAATAMILNAGGIDPFSFKHYCYGGPNRNVFLLRNGLLSFANPTSSHRITDSHLDLAIMPADTTCSLLVLITILLPIANKLRTLKGQFRPFQSTHLWVLPRRHTNGQIKWRYNSNDVNEKLKAITTQLFGVAVNGEVIRKMVHQVFSSEFPLLFSNSMRLQSPVDVVAQHLWVTGIHNYGKLGHFPPHPSLVGDRPGRHAVHCEVWHALTKVGPIHEPWRPMVQGTSLFPERTFPDDAFYVARRQVLIAYKVRDASQPFDRANLVKRVLADKPFLQGISVRT